MTSSTAISPVYVLPRVASITI